MNFLREEFPILKDVTHFDVALMAPVSNPLIEMYREFYSEVSINGGDKDKWHEKVNNIRRQIANLIKAEAGEIAFVKNTSEGINMLAHSIDYSPGDNIVISDQEHVNNIYPWMNMKSCKIVTRKIKSRNYYYELTDIKRVVDKNTKVISLTTVCPRSGFRPDLYQIGKFCKERGIYFFLDAVQSLGVLDMDVHNLGIDALATSGHKWLLGPYGAGFLYCRKDLINKINPVFAAKLYIHDDPKRDNTAECTDARKWEYGSPNYTGILGLGTGIKMISTIGINNVEKRVINLADKLRSEIEELGLKVISPADNINKSGILCFKVKDPELTNSHLKKENIFVSLRGGNIRVSIHFYNNEEDLDKFIRTLKKFYNTLV